MLTLTLHCPSTHHTHTDSSIPRWLVEDSSDMTANTTFTGNVGNSSIIEERLSRLRRKRSSGDTGGIGGSVATGRQGYSSPDKKVTKLNRYIRVYKLPFFFIAPANMLHTHTKHLLYYSAETPHGRKEALSSPLGSKKKKTGIV